MTNFNEHLKLSSWNYQIMELENEALRKELETCSRQTIINWLQWNDRNGIYADDLSFQEFGSIMTREEGMEIMIRQIEENRKSV